MLSSSKFDSYAKSLALYCISVWTSWDWSGKFVRGTFEFVNDFSH